jgi:hypothetical protein
MSKLQQRWLWATELLVHDMGVFRFKGVSEPLRLVSVTTKVRACGNRGARARARARGGGGGS